MFSLTNFYKTIIVNFIAMLLAPAFAFAGTEIGGPSGTIFLENAVVEGNNLKLTAIISNQTDNFLDGLGFLVEVFHGEKLGESGFIFNGLERVYEENISFEKNMPPRLEDRINLDVKLPNTLNSGNHFVKLYFFDDSRSFEDVDYTKEPIVLSGSGVVISGVNEIFLNTQEHGLTFAREGRSLQKDQNPEMVIVLNESEDIETLKQNPKAYLTAVNAFTGETIYSNREAQGEVKSFDGYTNTWSVPVFLTDEMREGGAFDIDVSLKTEQGGHLFNTALKVLMEYGQPIVNILKIDVSQSQYSSGDKINSLIEISALNAVGQKFKAELDIKGEDGTSNKYTKDFTISKNGLEVVNLNDLVVENDINAQKIKVSIFDASGRGITSKEISLDVRKSSITNEGQGDDLEGTKENFWTSMDDNKKTLVYAIAFIIFILLVILLVLKGGKGKKSVGNLAIVFVTASVFAFTGVQTANAQCACGDPDPNVQYWIDNKNTSSTNLQCGDTARMTVKIRFKCKHCLNGTGFNFKDNQDNKLKYRSVLGDSGGKGSAPHNDRTLIYVVEKKNLTKGSHNLKVEAAFLYNGCHCCKAPEKGPATQLTWAEGYIGALQRTFNVNSCDVNATCGSANGQSYQTQPDEENLCGSGAGRKGPVTQAEDGSNTWSWTCEGIGDGQDIQCSTNTCSTNFGSSCTSEANACGATNSGVYNCSGVCVNSIAGNVPVGVPDVNVTNPSYGDIKVSAPNACGVRTTTRGTCSSPAPNPTIPSTAACPVGPVCITDDNPDTTVPENLTVPSDGIVRPTAIDQDGNTVSLGEPFQLEGNPSTYKVGDKCFVYNSACPSQAPNESYVTCDGTCAVPQPVCGGVQCISRGNVEGKTNTVYVQDSSQCNVIVPSDSVCEIPSFGFRTKNGLYTVDPGTEKILVWDTVLNATSCTIKGPNNETLAVINNFIRDTSKPQPEHDWTNIIPSGEIETGPINQTSEYKMTCVNVDSPEVTERLRITLTPNVIER